MPIVVLTIRLVIAFVLVVAVVGKLIDRASTVAMFAGAGIPAPLRRPVAVALVVAEAVTAALLLVPPAAMLGALAATLLFGALAAGVFRIVRTGRTVACNCFGGTGKAPLSSVHFYRNLGLTAISLTALALSAEAAGPTLPGLAIAGFTALVIAAIVVRLDDLVDLFR